MKRAHKARRKGENESGAPHCGNGPTQPAGFLRVERVERFPAPTQLASKQRVVIAKRDAHWGDAAYDSSLLLHPSIQPALRPMEVKGGHLGRFGVRLFNAPTERARRKKKYIRSRGVRGREVSFDENLTSLRPRSSRSALLCPLWLAVFNGGRLLPVSQGNSRLRISSRPSPLSCSCSPVRNVDGFSRSLSGLIALCRSVWSCEGCADSEGWGWNLDQGFTLWCFFERIGSRRFTIIRSDG